MAQHHPIPSKDTTREIYNSSPLNNLTRILHKFQMHRVLLDIVVPILCILKLDNKHVRDAALYSVNNTAKPLAQFSPTCPFESHSENAHPKTYL